MDWGGGGGQASAGLEGMFQSCFNEVLFVFECAGHVLVMFQGCLRHALKLFLYSRKYYDDVPMQC